MVVFSWTVLLSASFFWGIYSSATDASDFNFCYEKACYHKSDRTMTWDQANDYCGDMDATLTSIHSAEENAYITDYVRAGPNWIGLTDSESEGVWRWVDGTAFDYNNWEEDEPNNALIGEHTVHMRISGVWNDISETKYFTAVCKLITAQPTFTSTAWPTFSPTVASKQTTQPTISPSASPTIVSEPTTQPTFTPTAWPTFSPTVASKPTTQPTMSPSASPTIASEPTTQPTISPSASPTFPTARPTSQKQDSIIAFGMPEIVIGIASVIIICVVVLICILFCFLPGYRRKAYHEGVLEAQDRTIANTDVAGVELEVVFPTNTEGEI